MSRSARLPGANLKLRMSPEQEAKSRAKFEAMDARGRLYITCEEQVAMIRTLGFCEVSFGPSAVWLDATDPIAFRKMFDFILKFRTEAALAAEPSL